MSSLFRNYSLVEIIHLLIRFNKTKSFLWKNREYWYKWYKLAPRTERKIILERVLKIPAF